MVFGYLGYGKMWMNEYFKWFLLYNRFKIGIDRLVVIKSNENIFWNGCLMVEIW